ncbi:MAG TPA: FAD-dependent oxidoreductase [Nocardioidaceae bacterium]|nr:FAD-dependent oxidoreductase [Nocardioidaceae bacterium]
MARVVVVGGGLGGCAAAARLAKLGHEVRLVERSERVGGAVGFVEQDGYRWDGGPHATLLPAVLRDLFRKTGRPLERELELVPLEPLREHWFDDGTVLTLPGGSRAAQQQAIETAFGTTPRRGPAPAQQWLDYTHALVPAWNALRRDVLERHYSPEHATPEARALLGDRTSLRRRVRKALPDPRLQAMAELPAVLDGQEPRDVPAWAGVTSYLEQNFGLWTVADGFGAVAAAMAARLAQRKVQVLTGTTARDLALRSGHVAGVVTDTGCLEADVVVCAVDPRSLPALAGFVARTTPAVPPVVCHLGLAGELPDLPGEVVLHGDPLLVVRRTGNATGSRQAWTVLARGRVDEDVVEALARRGLDVREHVEVRVDRSPRDLVAAWGGSPYGLRWEGRGTMRRRLGTVTPVPGVLACGASAGPGAGVGAGVPFVGLGAALVAAEVGRA